MFGNNKFRKEAPIGLALGASAATATAAGVAAVAGAASVAGTIMSAKAAKDQAKAQKASMQAQSRAAGAEAQRARIQAVREARIQRAMMESAAGKAGIGFQSSGVVGAGSSIGSQLGANIGNQNVQLGFADMASAANQRAADAASRGAQWQAVGQVAGSIFQAKGGWGSIFGGNTIPSVGAPTPSFGSGTASKAIR